MERLRFLLTAFALFFGVLLQANPVDIPVPSREFFGVDLFLGESSNPNTSRFSQTDTDTGAIAGRISAVQDRAEFSYFDGRTEVEEATGRRQIFYWNDEGEVARHEEWEGDRLYRQRRYVWSGRSLLGVFLEDGRGDLLLARTFTYNKDLQLTSERCFGSISGTATRSIQLDSNAWPSREANESYGHRYEYEEGRLSLEEDDFGRQTLYLYNESGQLYGRYLAFKGQVQSRNFYHYDDDGTVIEWIRDDGRSLDEDDVQGITERRLIRTTPKYVSAGQAVPAVVEEFSWDSDIQSLLPKSMTVRDFSADGQLLAESLYDGELALQSMGEYGFDSEGRLSYIHKDGKRQGLVYDASGKVAAVQYFDQGCVTEYVYDSKERLVAERALFADGQVVVARSEYDSSGRPSAVVDTFGNRTDFSFDAFGRRTQQLFPEIDTGERVYRPSKQWQYDIFDHVIEAVDENGLATRVQYNILGKPVRVELPGGAFETFHYNLDGTLSQHIDAQKVEHRIEYDPWGRPIRTLTVGSDGEHTVSEERQYDGFQLTSIQSSSGVHQNFDYDGSGRIREVSVDDGFHSSRREYEYDAQGQLLQAKDWFGYGSDDFVTAGFNGSLLEVSNAQGELLKQTSVDGSAPRPGEYSQEKQCLDASPRWGVLNHLGQNVLQMQATDADGNLTITTYDALGRVADVLQKGPFGQTLMHREAFHDGKGNKIAEINHGAKTALKTQWVYGVHGRLGELREAVGSSDERVTFFMYDDAGRLSECIQASGTVLEYFYDGLGRLSRLCSSDGSVDYSFTLDEQGRVTSVWDSVLGAETIRTYDGLGNLNYEMLGNGLEFSVEHDRTGRPVYVDLPDDSGIEYSYDGILLTSICRIDQQQNELYRHQYYYDLDGRIIGADLAGSDIEYSWDSQGRLQTVNSPFWSEYIAEEGRDEAGRIRAIDYSDPAGAVHGDFLYDSLGQLELESAEDSQSYRYDSLYNRTEVGEDSCEVNFLNQMLRQGEHDFVYDTNGNLCFDGEAHYSYDALNRLVAVQRKGESLVTYTYDAFNRRLSRSVGGKLEHFFYHEMNEVGRVIDGKVDQLRILGVGSVGEMGAAVAIELKDTVYQPIHDHQGSVRCLVNVATGEAEEFYRFSAFGVEQLFNREAQSIEASEAINPWRFSSKRTDAETRWVYFGRRYLSPELGRWVTCDPMGYFESPNLYAYTLNDPLRNKDPYGLFSVSEVFEAFLNVGFKLVSTLINATLDFSSQISERVSIIGQMGLELESIAMTLIGRTFFRVAGYHMESTTCGTIGRGEVSDTIRVTYINGILNNRVDCIRAAEAVSDTHGGCNVHFIHSATSGFTWDLIKGLMGKTGYTTTQATLLAHYWKAMIAEMGGVEGEGRIIHYAHSMGGTDTAMACNLLSPEERSMIEVVTFGSPSLISDQDFGQVINYVSRRDGIPLLDAYSYVNCFFDAEANVVFVGDYRGIPLIDHLFSSPNYQDVLGSLGEAFVESYGILG